MIKKKVSNEAENPALGKTAIMCSFSVGDTVKLVKKMYWMQTAKKGQVGEILKCAISLNKPTYWVKFKGGEEWWNEEQVVQLAKLHRNGCVYAPLGII
jgi:hypothetical protein